MSHHDLTDDQWNAIRDFFPAKFSRRPGRPWADHRRIVSAILWILLTGSPWRSLPAEFGSWQTAYNRFQRWIDNDLWDEVYAALLHQADACGHVDRSLWCVDGTVIRAHRCASGMLPQSVENDEMNALGRSRGGYSMKLHVLTDANGLLMSWTASPGQRHESQELKRLLANSLFPVDWIGHRPQAIAGDKGYGSAEIREHIARKRIQVVIPRKSNEAPAEDFNPKTYRRRNIVERAIGWLKVSRRVFVRYDKLTSSYLAFVQLAAM